MPLYTAIMPGSSEYDYFDQAFEQLEKAGLVPAGTGRRFRATVKKALQPTDSDWMNLRIPTVSDLRLPRAGKFGAGIAEIITFRLIT